MSTFQSAELLKETTEALERIQSFNPEELRQRERLGSENDFSDTVPPAKMLIEIFKQLPISSLKLFCDKELNSVKTEANTVYDLITNITAFDLKEGDVANRKKTLVDGLQRRLQPSFSALFPLISFSLAKTIDFAALEAQARASAQNVRDQSAELVKSLEEQHEQANNILEQVRKTAAEQGVSQEAYHFSKEADDHANRAVSWLWASVGSGLILLCYAVSTLFFPWFEFFKAETVPEAVQLTVSKALIFVVLAYATLQSVRNYNAHRHNSVTNRHRQNALMTYKTLTDAGGTPEVRNLVIQHAAAAVYSPNDSGYLKSEDRNYQGNPIIGISPSHLLDNSNSG